MIEDLFAQLSDRELRNLMMILIFGTIGLGFNGYNLLNSRIKRYEFLAKERVKDTKERTDQQILMQPVIEFFGLLVFFLAICTAAFLFFALRD